jgi:copper chaperone CopZ
MTDVTILVPEISCGTCKNAIEGALTAAIAEQGYEVPSGG